MTTRAREGLVTLVVLALLAATGSVARSQQPSASLRRTLASSASGRWRDAPFASSTQRIADAFSTPLWIDRRLDPTTPVTLTAGSTTLAATLDKLAAAGEARGVALDRLVYLGPAKSAAVLPALAKQWRQTAMRGMRRRDKSAWPRLTTPRSIATKLVEGAGCQLANAEAIPHDLWPAYSTPKMTAGDRLTLVLIGFDLRWTLDEANHRIVRIEPIDYRTIPAESATLAESIGEKPAPGPVMQRYTLRVKEQPLDAVLRQLAEQLGYRLVFQTSWKGDRAMRVSFQVEQASLGEMLGAIGESARATITAEGDSITVSHKPSRP